MKVVSEGMKARDAWKNETRVERRSERERARLGGERMKGGTRSGEGELGEEAGRSGDDESTLCNGVPKVDIIVRVGIRTFQISKLRSVEFSERGIECRNGASENSGVVSWNGKGGGVPSSARNSICEVT